MSNMMNVRLFQYGNQWITNGDILNALKEVDADKCDVLLLHTAMEFGALSREIKRRELNEIMYDLIKQLGVNTLVFPTFSFSFANKEDYDVRQSKSKMGMLNEYIRKQDEAVRSLDPLMSVCVVGENQELAQVSGDSSLGEGGFFDRLHHTSNARIAFLGVDEIICNTHLHYVEEQLQVPYRYHLSMNGNVIDYDGNVIPKQQKLFVTYKHVTPGANRAFYDELTAKGQMKKVFLGGSSVSCFKEEDVYELEKQYLQKDINSFLVEPYDKYPLIKEFTYGGVDSVR